MTWFFEHAMKPEEMLSQMESIQIVMKGQYLQDRKKCATTVDVGEDQLRVYAKGGPDFLIKNCTKILMNDGSTPELDEAVSSEHWESYKTHTGGKKLKPDNLTYRDLLQ